jgi:competence protein ComEA
LDGWVEFSRILIWEGVPMLQWERRHQLVLLVVAAVVLFVVGFKYALIREQDVLFKEQGLVSENTSGDAVTMGEKGLKTSLAGDDLKEVVVHVAGAVQRPGVYRLPLGSRIVDAVDAAGATGDSALDYLNLAAQLEDGKQVYVFSLEDINKQQTMGLSAPGVDPTASGFLGVATPGGVNAAGLININTAGPAELEELPGIGPSLAQRIIDHRIQNGSFSVIEDVMQVSGIGAKRFEQIKGKICVH